MQCISDKQSASPKAKGPQATDSFQERNNHDWRGQWRFPHSEITKPTPNPTSPTEVDSKVLSSTPITSPAVQQEESPKWGWGARREERRKRRDEIDTTRFESEEKEEVQKIKEAVDKIWAERKQAAIDIQTTANEKVGPSLPNRDVADKQAKEYARVKLESLSQAVDTLRAVCLSYITHAVFDHQALTADAEKVKDPKLV
jgi:hypothetical protein